MGFVYSLGPDGEDDFDYEDEHFELESDKKEYGGDGDLDEDASTPESQPRSFQYNPPEATVPRAGRETVEEFDATRNAAKQLAAKKAATTGESAASASKRAAADVRTSTKKAAKAVTKKAPLKKQAAKKTTPKKAAAKKIEAKKAVTKRK